MRTSHEFRRGSGIGDDDPAGRLITSGVGGRTSPQSKVTCEETKRVPSCHRKNHEQWHVARSKLTVPGYMSVFAGWVSIRRGEYYIILAPKLGHGLLREC